MSKAKMTVYLVIDHGGEWEDSWSAPYMAFADEQAAKECAEKRCRRKPQDLNEYPSPLWTSTFTRPYAPSTCSSTISGRRR